MILSKQRLEAINFKKFCESSLNSKYLITAMCKPPSHILSPNQNSGGNLDFNNFDQGNILPFFPYHQIMKCVQSRVLLFVVLDALIDARKAAHGMNKLQSVKTKPYMNPSLNIIIYTYVCVDIRMMCICLCALNM